MVETTSSGEVEVPPRRGVRWGRVAILVILIFLLPASLMARRAAAKLEYFHLRSVSIEGTRYLSSETVMQRLAVDTMRSVWDDTDRLAEKLRSLPQVSDVSISRQLPGTLVVAIRENLPIALASTPRGLEAVDTLGVVLPIDLANADLDLPIANHRDRGILSLLGGIRRGDPMLFRRISEVSRDGANGVVLQFAPLAGAVPAAGNSRSLDSGAGVSAVARAASLRVRADMGVSVSRLADIFPVESDLRRRRASIAELDLRYRDQVIARLQ